MWRLTDVFAQIIGGHHQLWVPGMRGRAASRALWSREYALLGNIYVISSHAFLLLN